MAACWRHDKIGKVIGLALILVATATVAHAAGDAFDNVTTNSIFWATDVGYGPRGVCREMVRMSDIRRLVTGVKSYGSTIAKQDIYSDSGVGVIKLFIVYKDGTPDEMVFSTDYGYCLSTAAGYQWEYMDFIKSLKAANR